MYAGKTLFAQVMDFLPWTTFHVLDLLLPEPGAFYVMDRGYLKTQ